MLLVAFIGGWQAVGDSSEYWKSVVSAPTDVAGTLGAWLGDGAWWSDLADTLQEALFGYLLGTVLACILVAIVVPIPVLDRYLRPFIAMLNSLPKIVLAPLFIVWFGLSLQSKVYFVAAAMFFIVFYGLYSGVKTIDKTLLDNARMLGASGLKLVRAVHAPAVVTWLMTGLRVSAAIALLAAVISEYLGAATGIGYRIAAARNAFQTDQILAGIIVVAVIAVILDRFLVRLQRRFQAWRIF